MTRRSRRELDRQLTAIESSVPGDAPPEPWMAHVASDLWDDRAAAWRAAAGGR